MCGRYTRSYTWKEVHDFLDLQFPEQAEIAPSYNVAPTQASPIVRRDAEGRRGLAMARWGLVPGWAKDEKIGSQLINARCETLSTTPAYRTAFARDRCVVPVSGFYEWQASGGGRGRGGKQPWYVRRADGAIMCLAGLCARCGRGAGPVETFSIATTAANEFMAPLHDRMPVVLEPEDVAAWLDPAASPEALAALLRPAAAGVLTGWEVSRRVNSPRCDEPGLIEPAEHERQGELGFG
ncbi:MAG TPA: SOS response-associated peptidase [Phycisphaerales bacterium]|nr:SOS response-associated peptidase [Phycisphaerales bacterium]